METVAIIILYCLHYVVLYSQNVELYEACSDGNVSRVSELLTRGAHVNYSQPGFKVSIVSSHMMLVTDPHISIYYHTQSVVEHLVLYVC